MRIKRVLLLVKTMLPMRISAATQETDEILTLIRRRDLLPFRARWIIWLPPLKCSSRHLVLLAGLILVLALMLIIPTGWTPMRLLIPEYTTWHPITTVHLIKIMTVDAPPGVRPVNSCSAVVPLLQASGPEITKIRFYNDALDKIKNPAIRGSLHEKVLSFLPIMTSETKISLLNTYKVLAEALDNAGIEHVVLHGTLLGIYRFSSIQPWDDDIDVSINASRWSDVRDALSCIQGFELFVDPLMRWSFFPREAQRSEVMPMKKYPFVDIFFYAEDETHVWGLHYINRHRSVFPKSEMFPYRRSRLDGLDVPVPYNVEAILRLQYGDLSICATQYFLHFQARKNSGVINLSCHELSPLYGEFVGMYSDSSN